MKKYQLFPIAIIMLWLAACSGGQKIQSYEPGCDRIVVNVNAGVINGIGTNATAKKISEQFPCAKEGMDESCGSIFRTEDLNFYFYPDQQFIEVQFPFEGEENPQVITTSREQLIQQFGKPARSETARDIEIIYFKMDYGTLVVEQHGGKSKNFSMHAAAPEEVELCH